MDDMWGDARNRIVRRIIIVIFFAGVIFVLGGVGSIIINGEDGSIDPIIIGIPIIIIGIILKIKTDENTRLGM